MKLPVVLICALALTGPTIVASQETPRATLVTKTGDVVEGSIFFASDKEVIVIVAGQQIKVPLATLRYISFEGKIGSPAGGTTASTGSPTTPLSASLAAFASLGTAAEIGMLREQYSEKLLETMPPIREFIKSGSGWTNVRLAMEQAARAYSYPLSSLDAWKAGSASLTEGRIWADYAAKLASDPAEETHVERQDEQPMEPMVTYSGRLAFGDRLMPATLDESSAAGFNDVYVIDIPVKTGVSIVMDCSPCMPHLTLVDQNGKKVEGDMGYSGRSTIQRNLNPGRYQLWAGTVAGLVGHYTLHRRGR